MYLHKGLGKTPSEHDIGMRPEGLHSGKQAEAGAADGRR